MRAQRSTVLWWRAVLVATVCLAGPLTGQEGLRQVHVGDPMPEFSLPDPSGTVFHYTHGQARVLGVVVLQATQSNLARLVADVEILARTLKSETAGFDCVGVMSGPGAQEYVRSHDLKARDAFPVLVDPNFAFWGKLGVIAAPTAVVVGADHKVRWVKAGYGYDFVAGFHAQMAQALGLAAGTDATVRVETLDNDSSRARRDRHIQLARTLARKGRFDSAMKELEKLRQLDPNAADVALELGEVLCRAGKNEAALKVTAEAKVRTDSDRARALMISAWAKRQMGDLDAADALLTKALQLEPQSPRILYELGKVYQSKGDSEKALACYRRALAEVFGDAGAAGSSQK
jgi:Tfp pilus assembly protein PilF